MKIVPHAKLAWRWFSMQSFAAATAIQVTWINLPVDMKESIPATWVSALTIAVCVAGALGRLVDQGRE